MRTVLLAAFVALATWSSGAPSVPTAPAAAVQGIGAARRIVRVSRFCPGTPRARVEAALGKPTYNVENDLYIYLNYRPMNDEAMRAGLTAMLVVFARDRVSQLKFVDPDDLRRQLAAMTEPAPSPEPLPSAPRR